MTSQSKYSIGDNELKQISPVTGKTQNAKMPISKPNLVL